MGTNMISAIHPATKKAIHYRDYESYRRVLFDARVRLVTIETISEMDPERYNEEYSTALLWLQAIENATDLENRYEPSRPTSV